MANDLLEEIKLAGIRGFVVPAAYRQPKITRDMAQAIAFEALDGHVWTAQEQVSLNGEEYALESATTLSPLELLTLLADELGLEWGTDDRHKNKISLQGAAAKSGPT